MNILVTGGAGFIGANFVYYELGKHPDDNIICLDKLTYAGNPENLKEAAKNPKFTFVKADICDRDAIYSLFEKYSFDIVVNFAAESHVDRSIEEPEVFLKTNILGTQVLMDASREFGVKRYHQVSTDEVYGDLPLDKPELFFTEETPIHTSSPYSASKFTTISNFSSWKRFLTASLSVISPFTNLKSGFFAASSSVSRFPAYVRASRHTIL